MIFKPHQIVIVVNGSKNGTYKKSSIYELTCGNEDDEAAMVQGYELRRDMRPTGVRHDLNPKDIVLFARNERKKMVQEMRATLARQDRILAEQEENLSKHETDFDEHAFAIESIIQSKLSSQDRVKAIAKYLEEKSTDGVRDGE